MTFETKFGPGERVAWISEIYGKPLRGEVKKVEVVLEPKNRQDETYTVYCDEQGVNGAIELNGMDLFPESFYSSMGEQMKTLPAVSKLYR
jgi:hypothetical protein